MTVLICGATGHTGTEIIRLLRDAGEPVRAMTRNEQAAESMGDHGIETVIADLDDPASLARAVEGVRSIYIATSTSASLVEEETNLVRAAAQASVEHVVKLSVLVPEEPSQVLGRLHFAAEDAVKASGLRWTILRGNTFMQTTLWWWASQIPHGIVYGPVMDAHLSIVDLRDAARAAVAALRDPDSHAGKTYAITGPESTSSREQIAILSELLGRPLEAREVSIEDAKQKVAASEPPWTVDALGELWQRYADGHGVEATTPDVETMTGRQPLTYNQFARDHLERFAG